MKNGPGSSEFLRSRELGVVSASLVCPQLSGVRLPSSKKRTPVAAAMSRPDFPSADTEIQPEDSADLHTRLGFSHMASGNWEGAVECFQLAYDGRQADIESRNSSDTSVLYLQEELGQAALNLGFALAKRGMTNEAAAKLAEAEVYQDAESPKLGVQLALRLPQMAVSKDRCILALIYGESKVIHRSLKEIGSWLKAL